MADIQSLVAHLEAYRNTHATIDDKLVAGFTQIIANNTSIQKKDDLAPVLSQVNGIFLESPNLDPNDLLIDLLSAVLAHFSFIELKTIYTELFILESALNADTAAFIFKVIQEKVSDPETVRFLSESRFLYNGLQTYFAESTGLSTVSAYENLISIACLSDSLALVSQLESVDAIALQKSVRTSGNSTLLTRLVDFVALIAPYTLVKGVSPTNLDHSVFKFTRPDFLQDDPLLVILLISFYFKLVALDLQDLVLETIKPCLYDIVYLYSLRTSDANVQSFYAVEIVGVLAKWSYSTSPSVIAYLTEVLDTFQLFKSFNIYLDEIGTVDVQLLSEFNPQLVNNDEFVDELISSYNLFQKRFFTILLNLVSYSAYFDKLNFSTQQISKLPYDMLFRFLYELSKFKHSTLWLLSQPQIINDYVLGTTVTENEIWTLKKKTLENLLWRNSVDELGVWHASIKETYSVMCNGRDVKNIAPSVQVASEAV